MLSTARACAQCDLSGRDLDAEHQLIMDAVLVRDADAAVAHTVDHFVKTTRIILLGELKSEVDADRMIAGLRAEIKSGTCQAPRRRTALDAKA